ncbi:MAG: hypothetical protein R6X20_04690 [Phycisphaerae bacterium]
MPKRISKAALAAMVQQYEAVSAVGTSAVRGQPRGTADAVRTFLGETMTLSDVPRRNRALFDKWLNNQTRRIQRRLPNPDRPWGIARKTLNLFLRSCFYNRLLCERYGLEKVGPWLEVPLDSVVAKGLRRHARKHDKPKALPKWLGLGGLTPAASRAFQEYALEYADSLGLPARVFLDNYLWLRGRGSLPDALDMDS